MSEIQKRLNEIIKALNSKQGTPNVPTILKDIDGIYKMSDSNGKGLTFNNEQEIKDYFNKQQDITGIKTRYVIIQIVDNSDLERVMYD